MCPKVLHTTYSSNVDIGIHCYRTTGTYPCIVLLLDYIQGIRRGRMTYCYYQDKPIVVPLHACYRYCYICQNPSLNLIRKDLSTTVPVVTLSAKHNTQVYGKREIEE